VKGLGARLIFVPDGNEAGELTAQYHETLEEIRRLESVLIRVERWF
jgi:hypothetical protein